MNTTYQPELQAAYINNNRIKMKKIMAVIIMSFFYLFIVGTVAFIVVGIPILRIVKPEISLSISILLSLCLYQMILKYRNCYTSYFSCTNRIIYLKGFIISALLCIVLSLLMMEIFRLGVWGLILAQIVSQVFYNLWHWSLLAHKELNMTSKDIILIGTGECVNLLETFLWRKNDKV